MTNNTDSPEMLDGLSILARQEYSHRPDAYDDVAKLMRHTHAVSKEAPSLTGLDIARGSIMNREVLQGLYPDADIPAAHELITMPLMYDGDYNVRGGMQSTLGAIKPALNWVEGVDYFVVSDRTLLMDGTSRPGMSVFLSPKAYIDMVPLGSSVLWDGDTLSALESSGDVKK